jgi:hypothetical protein
MADLGRLDDTVAGIEHKWVSLILIDDANPAVPAVYHLEVHLVVVHPVGNEAAVRDADL